MGNHSYSLFELVSDIKSDIKLMSGSSKFRALFYFVFSPRVKVLFYYRLSHWFYTKGFLRLAYIIRCFQSKYGCYISERSVIGKRLFIPHPVGIVIGEGVVIEDNVSIWQNVTLGTSGKPGIKKDYPYIQRGAKIYSGAAVLGDITIGENAVVGANSVVLADVPQNSVAVGVPYRGLK